MVFLLHLILIYLFNIYKIILAIYKGQIILCNESSMQMNYVKCVYKLLPYIILNQVILNYNPVYNNYLYRVYILGI